MLASFKIYLLYIQKYYSGTNFILLIEYEDVKILINSYIY